MSESESLPKRLNLSRSNPPPRGSKPLAPWKESVKEFKKAKSRNETAMNEAEAKVRDLTRESRELAEKAKEIEDAVYDLKVVNPRWISNVDIRTPEELMEIIEAKGREIAEALAELRASDPVILDS